MEEFEAKLNRNNSILILSTITKLVDTIKTKYIEQQKISTANTIECKELEFLREKCLEFEHVISLTACQGIITLVEEGLLNPISTLSEFVSALSSARSFSGIIQAVGSILIFDMKTHLDQNETYRSPFSLRSPQHPFILILKQNQNTWHDVFNQMQSLCSYHNEKIAVSSIDSLRPVFFYILCNPSDSYEVQKNQLWGLLIKLIHKSVVKELIFDLLLWLRLKPATLCLQTTSMYVNLIETSVIKRDTELCIGMSPYLASMIYYLIKFGQDPRSAIFTLERLIEAFDVTESNDVILMVLADAILICPSVYLENLIGICKILVKKGGLNAITARMIVATLLQWMAHSSPLINEPLKTANKIINSIQNTDYSTSSNKLKTNKWFHSLKIIFPQVNLNYELYRLSGTFSNENNLKKWLCSVLNSPLNFMKKLFNFISSIYIGQYEDIEIIKYSNEVLLKLVKMDNNLAMSVLTLLLHKLSKEKEPELQLLLLNSIPDMAVAKENIPIILHTVESLKNGPVVLKLLSVDLFLKLWQIERRCYPYLQKVLVDATKDKDGEMDIITAKAIKEICGLSPDPHGKELVSVLSNVLNTCGGDKGSIPCAFAMQAITSLCNSKVISITSTWKVLAPKLKKDQRPIVIKSLCEMFSEVPNLKSSNEEEYNNLVDDVINELWRYITHSENVDIIATALKALSNFDVEDDMSLKHLPNIFRQKLKLPSAYCKTAIDAAKKPEDVLPYIPGECWVQLLQNIDHGALNAAGELLIHWVRKEINAYRDGVYYVSDRQGEPETYAFLPHKSFVRALADHVRLQALKTNLEDSAQKVVGQCLKILSENYSKPLPPLNWCFLHELFHINPETKAYCIVIATKQSLISGSARRFTENYLNDFVLELDTEEDCKHLYNNLIYLCRGVPSITLEPFIQKTLKYAFEKYKSEENKELIHNFLVNIKNALKHENIIESNKIFISDVIESYFDQMEYESDLFKSYTECVSGLHITYIERMTSPSVWWEITGSKLCKSVYIRSHLACKKDSEAPLILLNECIDSAGDIPSTHSTVLRNAAKAFFECREETSVTEWYLELLGRIQTVIVTKENAIQQIEFLCDVYILAVIIFSGHNCLALSFENVLISKETRFRLFTAALIELLKNGQWKSTVSETIEWLFCMSCSDKLSSSYRNTFELSLPALKHEKKFSDMWTKYLTKFVKRGV